MGLYVLFAIAIICAIVVIYPYLIYPVLLKLWPKRPVSFGTADARDGRSFTLLFCAYNEADSMPAKLQNIAELKVRYPSLSVLAFDDGSTDGTADLIERSALGIGLVRGSGRSGKAHGMKLLVSKADTEFLVFTDANVLLDISALDALVACYEDPSVGGVCGALRYIGSDESATAAVGGLYWRLEERLKDLESATGSVMGADGSIFSIRRALYPDFPDSVLDDLTVSMECVFRGYRLVKCNDVVAYEKLVSKRSDEFARKARIAGRAFATHTYLRPARRQMTRADRFRYASHKTVRWFGAAFLFVGSVAGIAAVMLISPLGAIAAVSGIALLIVVGLWTSSGLVSSCTEVLVAMVATLMGVLKALRGRVAVTWEPAKSRS